MTMRRLIASTLFAALWVSTCAAAKPNIVFILADDLGIGDVQCLNPTGKIPTPHLNRLAAEGMKFTDAHSSSAVCTPTRYGLLTGRYNWRSRLKSGVLGGMSPPLIEPGRLTVPAFLKLNGYHTACIGKWHLGMGWPLRAGVRGFDDQIEKGVDGWHADFAKPISHGPNSVGFDYYFGIAASLDMVPYTFIENDHVVAPPVADTAFPMMFGRTNRMTRRGPGAEGFAAEAVLPTLTRQAVDYITRRAVAAKSGRPFFLYLPLNAPHTPIAPTKEWQGKSGLNPYADFVMQTDASVGEVLDTLEEAGLATNTIVFFASDNGCSPEARFGELAAKGHFPSARFRGAKADIFDGGHRIPFLVRWPGHVKMSSASDQLVCLNDLFATVAEILDSKLPDTAAEDSVSLLPVLESRSVKPVREALVHHSINGSFAIRQGRWKLELCADSGGWSAPRPGSSEAKRLPAAQLYDLAQDPGETKNLQSAHPEVIARLTALLEKYVVEGRSTPGQPQTNTTPVTIQKTSASAATGTSPIAKRLPNIVIILADDMGYGDPGCYNSKSKIATPNIDRLAREGMRFTDAHAAGPLCHPSRYGLITGRYPFRTDVSAWPKKPLIAEGQVTIASLLRSQGYRTTMVGKWHLGFAENGYDKPLPGGPIACGFDSFFGLRASTDIPPYFFIRGDRAVVPPTDHIAANHSEDWSPIQGEFWREGGIAPGLMLKNVLPGWTEEALRIIGGQAATSPGARKPLLLYLAYTAPHTPWLPSAQFVGKSGAGMYGDFTTMVDAEIGRVLAALDTADLSRDTLLIFTSDNGPVWYQTDVRKFGHDSAGGLRGMKSDAWEGGHRMPFIVRWPGWVKARTVSDQTICFTDLLSTFADVCGTKLPAGAGPDSFSLLPVLEGRQPAGKPIRGPVVMQAGSVSSMMMIRSGNWKLITGLGSGGFSKPNAIKARPGEPEGQLYNLRDDLAETKNLYVDRPDVVARLKAELQHIVEVGNSD